MFGLFKILGHNFSPRFRDLDDQRFRRATMPGVETSTDGPVEHLARNGVNLNKVITHWPDILKVVAGSLVANQVRAYDLLRMFGRDGRPTPLGAVFAEYGRIAKSEHLLRVVDPLDGTYRRQMNPQLTAQESRHKPARDVCHGKRGTNPPGVPRRHGGPTLGTLGLFLHAIVLRTTQCIDDAAAHLRAEGHEIPAEDIARLSPLKHRNLNLLGRDTFSVAPPRPQASCAHCAIRTHRNWVRTTTGAGTVRKANQSRHYAAPGSLPCNEQAVAIVDGVLLQQIGVVAVPGPRSQVCAQPLDRWLDHGGGHLGEGGISLSDVGVQEVLRAPPVCALKAVGEVVRNGERKHRVRFQRIHYGGQRCEASLFELAEFREVLLDQPQLRDMIRIEGEEDLPTRDAPHLVKATT
ncbi:Tn3 family transposase [Streptomyces sp. NPDC002185]|uniref:Tn3 family transposase n=1 Tax=Streptomyces sp. NPDC002185 TaxID=3364636 RepID=UPI00368AC6E1